MATKPSPTMLRRQLGAELRRLRDRAQRTVALADRSHVMSNGSLRVTLEPKDADDTQTMVAAYFG